MEVCLGKRTEETAALYFQRTNNAVIRKNLPQKAKTVEEAVEDYRQTLLPGASSYGRIILADGRYVGDVWCYCMNPNETPNAMLSFCVFETLCWGRGVATEAVKLFIGEITERFHIATLGAFAFSDNMGSIRVLEKNGFRVAEEFAEDGTASQYFELDSMKQSILRS